MTKPETLCVHCDNFTCAWRQQSMPVAGWTAVPTLIRNCKSALPSCIVFECPAFQRSGSYANDDEWERIRKRGVQESIYHSLAILCRIGDAADCLTAAALREEVLRIENLYETELKALSTQIVKLSGLLADAETQRDEAERALTDKAALLSEETEVHCEKLPANPE